VRVLLLFLMLQVTAVLHAATCAATGAWAGVVRQEVGLGYGPRLAGVKVRGTLYSVRALLLGGFAKFDTASFDAASVWRRVSIHLSVLGILTVSGVALVGGFGAAADVLADFLRGTVHPAQFGVPALAGFCGRIAAAPWHALGAVFVCQAAHGALPLYQSSGGGILMNLCGLEHPDRSARMLVYAWASMILNLALFGIWTYVAIAAAFA
jgi:hypothetical protein